MNKTSLIKILVWAIIIHVLLIVITVLEVFAFSQFIEPNRNEQFYQEHAKTIAPYVAIIMGFIIVFIVTWRLSKKIESNNKWIGILLALTYIVIDIIILQISSVNWSEHYPVFLISFFTKLLAGYLGVIDFKKVLGK